MQYLQSVFLALQMLFTPPVPVDHLLAQMGSLEKTEKTIEHVIRKAHYNEKNPTQQMMIFDAPVPINWFPHTCQNECADQFTEIKTMVHNLHMHAKKAEPCKVLNLINRFPQLGDFLDDEHNTILHHVIARRHAFLTLAILCKYPHMAAVENKSKKTPIHLALSGSPRKVLLLVKAAYATLQEAQK